MSTQIMAFKNMSYNLILFQMALSQRKTVVEFTEQVLDKFLKIYQFSMDDDTKEALFKMFHVAIVVHTPQTNHSSVVYNQNDDLFAVNIANDTNLWHKHLRSIFSVVEREINGARKQRSNTRPTVCNKLAQMAAKLCAVVCISFDLHSINGFSLILISDILE